MAGRRRWRSQQGICWPAKLRLRHPVAHSPPVAAYRRGGYESDENSRHCDMKPLPVLLLCVATCWNIARCADTDNSWRLSTDDTAMVVTVQQGIPAVTRLGSPND